MFAVIWLSQFLSILSFSFAMPFVPYYFQELGVSDPQRLKLWVTLYAATAPMMFAIFSPIWGAMADRYGRRIMLLRANIGGMVVLALMGMVQSPESLVALRLLQGVFTGTMTAAVVMVSVQTPSHRSGMALGALSAAVFSGNMCGAFLGGIFAEYFGYRLAYGVSALIMMVAALLVLFGTSEMAAPTDQTPAAERIPSHGPPWKRLSAAFPILLMIGAIGCVIHFDQAWLPLLVQEINGGLQGVSLWTGSLQAIGGIAGFMPGPIIGRIADRIPPPRIAKVSAVGAAAMMLLIGVSYRFPLLFVARFGMAFSSGGLDPVFQIWLSKTTPAAHRGLVFGWAATARSLGWMIAPLLSGAVAWAGGIRAIFLAGALCYLFLIPVIAWVVRKMQPSGNANLPIGTHNQ